MLVKGSESEKGCNLGSNQPVHDDSTLSNLFHVELLLDSKRKDECHPLLQMPLVHNMPDQFDQVRNGGGVELEDGGETVQISGVPSRED